MCLRFQRDDCFDILDDEIVRCRVVLWGELFHNRTFGEGYIVLVCGNDLVRIFLGGFLDHLEQG